jgi:N-dimethylarginine dimethylaminohydrolase
LHSSFDEARRQNVRVLEGGMMTTCVADSWSELTRVLLCPPTYFSFQPINEITNKVLASGAVADVAVMEKEHASFVEAYESAGVTVELMEPVPGLPYMVYARDFGACFAEGALIGRFCTPQRQGEELLYKKRLEELGVPILGKVWRGTLEGGDFWFLDETTIAHGVIARSDFTGVQCASEILKPYGYEVIPIPVDSKNLHLDMCFNIVAEKTAVIAKDVLPDFFLAKLAKRHFDLIEIPAEGVFKHHCNIQALGRGRVLTFEANSEVNKALVSRGLEVVTAPLWETLKGGGGPHCMTFPLERKSA